MRRTAAILAGLSLASGAAFAALQEESTTDSYDEAEAQMEDQETGDPEMGTIPEAENAYGAEAGEEAGHDLSQMSSEELSGMSIMTAEGEEIGTIEQVGYSSMHQEKVATVNVGGFLGVGEKVIAIPLSKLEMGSDGALETTMSHEEIEAAQEFDSSDLSMEQQQ